MATINCLDKKLTSIIEGVQSMRVLLADPSTESDNSYRMMDLENDVRQLRRMLKENRTTLRTDIRTNGVAI